MLSGESIIGFARCSRPLGAMPPGLRRVAGPVLLAAARYTGSPVGPYIELAIGEPARLGVRLGWCITMMVADSTASRSGARANWGMAKELGTLVWDRDGADREVRWVERAIAVRAVPSRLRLPVLVPVRALQRRSDGPVVVPGRLRGVARLARVTVEAPPSDPLAAIAGGHPGCTVDGMRFVVRPARAPFGITSTLRAPLVAPEPALSSPVPPRAYSSAG